MTLRFSQHRLWTLDTTLVTMRQGILALVGRSVDCRWALVCHHVACIKFANCTQLWDGSHCWCEELSFSQWWYVAESSWVKLFSRMRLAHMSQRTDWPVSLWRCVAGVEVKGPWSSFRLELLHRDMGRRFFNAGVFFFEASIGRGPDVGFWKWGGRDGKSFQSAVNGFDYF